MDRRTDRHREANILFSQSAKALLLQLRNTSAFLNRKVCLRVIVLIEREMGLYSCTSQWSTGNLLRDTEKCGNSRVI